jgi:hypothetical protein
MQTQAAVDRIGEDALGLFLLGEGERAERLQQRARSLKKRR